MLTTDRVAGAVLVALGLFMTWESLWSARRLPLGSVRTPGPAYMPTLLAALLIVFGVVVLMLGARSGRISAVGWTEWRHTAGILVACAACAVLLERLGFRLTIALLLFTLLGVLERKHVVFALGFALALAFGTFYLFDTLLRVPLPRGPFNL
ncbi:MAG: tripartite tricarboxylate transporter TctB family protein [Candidatus Rokubacteria bacterium]|nr:tripartite tricarboxylate transporter TctB family protein [Candidatus Rokubacteria bacterium]